MTKIELNWTNNFVYVCVGVCVFEKKNHTRTHCQYWRLPVPVNNFKFHSHIIFVFVCIRK